ERLGARTPCMYAARSLCDNRPIGGGSVFAFAVHVNRAARLSGTDQSAWAAAQLRLIAQERDRKAFSALFAYFAPRVKAYLMQHGASAGVAEDLAQETMLQVWRKAAYYDPRRAGCATWIFTIARNLRIDALRRERYPDARLLEDEEATP